MLKNQGKEVFLIASGDVVKKVKLETWIKQFRPDALIFFAADHLEAVQKLKNAPPHAVVTDFLLAKAKGGELVDLLCEDPEYKTTPVIVVNPLPEREHYLDEIVTGKVQFFDEEAADFERCLGKALSFSTKGQSSDFSIRFLGPREVLIREGDLGECVFIVKKGQLRAWQKGPSGTQKVLGDIFAGEFVGEMSYFTGEARSCTVETVTECELIEVPTGTFERVLYLRPAWSKKLMETLSRRLKRAVK